MKFLKLKGHSRYWSNNIYTVDEFYLRVDSIVEIVPLIGSNRIKVRITAEMYDSTNDDHEEYRGAHYEYKPSVELTTQDPHNYSSSVNSTKALGSAESLIEKVERCRRKVVVDDALRVERVSVPGFSLACV